MTGGDASSELALTSFPPHPHAEAQRLGQPIGRQGKKYRNAADGDAHSVDQSAGSVIA
jgi:hypothetical protein